MAKILTIENLQYKNILKNISFSLEEKSFNILVGPNGSGKTTIVNCLRGIFKYKGNILVGNQDIKSDLNLLKKIGFFIDEEYILEKNIFEELLSFLLNLNYTEEKAKKRIYSISKKIGVTNILYKKQNELKCYEKTIVSFLFSVIHEPQILVIDNELNTLDKKNKDNVLNYITNMKKTTILFITTQSDYFELGTNFIFIKDGKNILSIGQSKIKDNEKTIVKSGSKLPFSMDLSNKLIAYELINNEGTNIKELVDLIWN